MTLLVTLLPLLNFLLLATASSFVNWRQLIALVLVSKSLVLGWSIVTFEKMILGETRVTKIGEWFDFGLLNVSWTFSIDPLTHVMIFTVMLVSTLVHTYSIAYMSEDPHLPRFLSYLSLFTFFMLVLISADNFVNLFLGWEGVGLCSYLLISFWYTRLQANKAAIKAMIVNRIADMALTLGMLTVFYTFQTTEFNVVFGLAPYISEDTRILFFGKEVLSITLCTALLFIGAMGKSAQLGLHTWLPDAMEGPSPVSALIHAATMVTAGVFLLVRCSVLFELAPSVLQYVAIIGAATAIMAATSGLFQNDLKKVIAYSTCSQLGFMVFACGVSQYSLSLFHLVNHAFFKALLFLGAGAVIHAVSNEQDTRKFGALSRLLPYTYVMFLIGSLALMGFPFLTGFYSKDVILEVTASGQTVTSLYAYNLGAITAFFTSFYSLRLLKLTFYGVSRSPRAYLLHTHELVEDMAYPLAVLALGSLFFGYFARDLFIGFGNSYWTGVITDATSAITAHREGEFLPLATKLVPLYGMLLALLVLLADDRIASPHYLLRTETLLIKFYRFLSSKWGFDAVYNEFLALKTLTFAYNNFALTDKGLLEAIGPTGLGQATHRIGLLLAKAQTGRVYDYAYFMLLGLYAGLILMDFVIDPIGVGYLVESTEVLTSTNSQTPLLTPPMPPIPAYQLKLYGYNHTLKNRTLTTVLRQHTPTLFSWWFLSISRFKLKSQLTCVICSIRFPAMRTNFKNPIIRTTTYVKQHCCPLFSKTKFSYQLASSLITSIREFWRRLVTMSGSRWSGCYSWVKSSPFYRVNPAPVVLQENLNATTLLPILIFLSIGEADTGVDITKSMAIYLYFSTLLIFNTALQSLDNLRPIQTTLANQQSTFAPTKQDIIMLYLTTILYSLTKAIYRWFFSTNYIVTRALQSRRVLPLPQISFILNVPPVAVPDGANEGFRLAAETQSMPMSPVIFAVVGLLAIGAAIWWGVAPVPVPVTPEMLRLSGDQLANLIEMIRANPAGVSAELLMAIMVQDETANQVLTGLYSLSVNQPEDFALLRADLRELVLHGVRRYMEAVARAEAGSGVPPVSPWYFVAGFLVIALVCAFMIWYLWPTAAVVALPTAPTAPTQEQKSTPHEDRSTLVPVDTDPTHTTPQPTLLTEKTVVGGDGSENNM